MKTRITIATLWSLLAAFTLAVCGCSTTKKVDWNSRVGNYTYDQAVTEFGPPDKQTTLSDGKLVADWVSRRHSGGASIGFGVGSFGHSGGVGVGVSQPVGSSYNDRVMRLTFGPDKKLVTWTKNY
jgi:hypothetical protein